MSERDEQFSGDKEAEFTVSFPNGEFIANRDNTTIFRHMGKLAMYDHVFFTRDEKKGQGTYLFNVHPTYEQIATHMMDNDFPAIINLRKVADCDREAYEQMLYRDFTGDLEGGVPDEWTT